MSVVFLTAYKVGPSAAKLSTPKVVKINSEQIKDIRKIPSTSNSTLFIAGTTKVTAKDSVGVYGVYETPEMIQAAMNPTSTNTLALGHIALSLDAHGNSAATGRAVTKYFSEIDTATTTSSDGVTLPTAVANKVMVVLNNTAVALEIWPNNASDTIADDSGAYSQGGYTRKHYVCEDSVNWQVAQD